MATGYVAQAGLGQLDLVSRARDIDDVVADPDTSARTRILLDEVSVIVEFAESRGLDSKGNYRKYVALPREAVVWFTAAAPTLSLEPKEWSFPIVGSFTYLGWFDFRAAMRFREHLRQEGYDVYLRGVRAFSTGGWFRDPVLSTMLPARDDEGFRSLANVLFHEMTHANVLLNDQSTFNESVAAFVGDTMAEHYLEWRFGRDSAELAAFRDELAEERAAGVALTAAYEELDAVYKSDASDRDKLAAKSRVMKRLEDELELVQRPNNAMLSGFRTYNSGARELRALFDHCQGDWPRFLSAIRNVRREDFTTEQLDAIGPVIGKQLARPCPAAPKS